MENEKEIDFAAIRAADKMLDEIWLNAMFAVPGTPSMLFVDMRDPKDGVAWHRFMDRLGGRR